MKTKVHCAESNKYPGIDSRFLKQAHAEASHVAKKRTKPSNQDISCSVINHVLPKSYETSLSVPKIHRGHRISEQKKVGHKTTLMSSVLKVLTWANLGMAYLLGVAPKFSNAFSACPNGYVVENEDFNFKVSFSLPYLHQGLDEVSPIWYPDCFCDTSRDLFANDRDYLDKALRQCTKLTDNIARNQLPARSFGKCDEVRFAECYNMKVVVHLYYAMHRYFCVPEQQG